MTRGRRLIRTFAPFVKPDRRRIALGVGLVLLSTGTSLLRPWPLKFLFDDLLAGSGAGRRNVATMLLLVAIAVAVIASLDGALRSLRQYVLKSAGQHVGFRLQAALYARLQQLSLTYHEHTPLGELITRITRDVDKVQDLSTETLVEAGSHVLKLGGMIGVMLWLDWQLSMSMLVLVPLLLVVTASYNRRVRKAERSARAEEGETTSLAQEALAAIRLVKAYGRESYEQQRFSDRAGRTVQANIRVSRTEAFFGALVDALVAVATAALIWFGARRVLAGDLTPGDLFVFVSYLRDFYEPVSSLSKLGGRVSRISVRAEKIADVLREVPGVREVPNAFPAPRFAGLLEFENVSFAYAGREPVLRDISFRIEPGEAVALVGASGAGKSTIAALVARLYDPTHGRVLIDGRDVRDFTLDSLRGQVGLLLQSAILFRATVRENIAYGRPGASFGEIVAAARVANAHAFIETLPQAYDTRVGERGDTLSGGQRQRIAIARAVIRDAPILILDEPTTGLDADSQQLVLDAVERLMRERTTIVIAHDIAMARRADRIFVLGDGRIAERGTHEELARLGGRYAELLEQTSSARS